LLIDVNKTTMKTVLKELYMCLYGMIVLFI